MKRLVITDGSLKKLERNSTYWLYVPDVGQSKIREIQHALQEADIPEDIKILIANCKAPTKV